MGRASAYVTERLVLGVPVERAAVMASTLTMMSLGFPKTAQIRAALQDAGCALGSRSADPGMARPTTRPRKDLAGPAQAGARRNNYCQTIACANHSH